MSPDRPTVLVTGATGVVGAPLLNRLPHEGVVCLSHSTAIPHPVEVIQGDITQPRLGLSERDYRELARRVDVVIHSAAATRFDLTREEIFATNVDGMGRMLDFVAEADARLVALSTAFVRVAGGAEHGWLSPRHYLDSKRAAEALVRDSGLDWHIVRPSVVIGDSESGEAARIQGFHFFIRALLRDQLPMIPVGDNDVLDFVAADLLADVLAAMVDGSPPWRESWLTGGPDAMPGRRVLETAVDIAHSRGLPVQRPRLMAPDAIDRLIRPVFFPELPKRIVRRYDQVASVSTVVVFPERFETTLPDLRRHYGREFNLDLEQTLERTIGYLIETLADPVGA
jgi:nucleoside-diphosphate-sugar epimerase